MMETANTRAIPYLTAKLSRSSCTLFSAPQTVAIQPEVLVIEVSKQQETEGTFSVFARKRSLVPTGRRKAANPGQPASNRSRLRITRRDSVYQCNRIDSCFC